MTEPTDADRSKSVLLLRSAAADGLIEATEPRKQPVMVDRLAAALADERERARAPFLALADELERDGTSDSGYMEYHEGLNAGLINAARAIRRAAEETP